MDIGKKRKEIQAQIQALQEASRNAPSQNQSVGTTPPPMNITKQFEQAYENNLEQTEQVNNSFKDKAKWVGKKGLFGAKSGTIGIGQGILTDTANEARKGEESSGADLIADGMNAIMSMVPGIGNSLGTAINSGRKIAKGEKGQKEKQTVGQMLVNASSGAVNKMPFKKTTNALIRIASNLVAKNSNNRMSDTYLAANNMLQKPLDEESEKLAKEGEQYGKTTQFIGNATESVGNMVPSIGAGLLTKNPTAALAAMGLSVKGRSTNETLKRLDKENYGYAEDFGGEAGNIDINHRQVYKNPDGKISTEKSETYGFTDENGKEKYYVLPTIIDGKDYSNDSDFVVNHFLETGEHLGAFDNEDDANRYAEDLHQRQEQYYSPEETRKRQSKQLNEAVKRGDTDAIIEVGTEMLTGGVKLFGKGTLDEIGESVVKQCKNEVLRFFVQQGVNVTGEIVEEAVSDILGTIIDKGTVDPDAKYTLKDFGETAAQTILTTMILNAFGIGDIKSAIDRNNLRTQINNTSYNENQKAYWNKQIQNNEITNSAQLGNEIDRVTKIDEIIDKTNLSEEQKSQLREYAREYNSQVGQIQNYSNYLSEQEQKNTKTEKNEKVEEKQNTTIKNKPLLESKQQTTQLKTKEEQKEAKRQYNRQYKENQKKRIARLENEIKNDKKFNELLKEGKEQTQRIKSEAEADRLAEKEKKKEYNKQYYEKTKSNIKKIEQEINGKDIKEEQKRYSQSKQLSNAEKELKSLQEKIRGRTYRLTTQETLEENKRLEKLTNTVRNLRKELGRDMKARIGENIRTFAEDKYSGETEGILKKAEKENTNSKFLNERKAISQTNIEKAAKPEQTYEQVKYNQELREAEENKTARQKKLEQQRESEQKEYNRLLDAKQHDQITKAGEKRLNELAKKNYEKLQSLPTKKEENHVRHVEEEKIKTKLTKAQIESVSKTVSKMQKAMRLTNDQTERLEKYAQLNNLGTKKLKQLTVTDVYKAIKSLKVQPEVIIKHVDPSKLSGVTGSEDYKLLEQQQKTSAAKERAKENKELEYSTELGTGQRTENSPLLREEKEREKRYKRLDDIEQNNSEYNGFEEDYEIAPEDREYSPEQQKAYMDKVFETLKNSKDNKNNLKRFNYELRKHFDINRVFDNKQERAKHKGLFVRDMTDDEINRWYEEVINIDLDKKDVSFDLVPRDYKNKNQKAPELYRDINIQDVYNFYTKEYLPKIKKEREVRNRKEETTIKAAKESAKTPFPKLNNDKPFVCVVVGSRNFDNYNKLKSELNRLLRNQKNVEIVSGGANGADYLAERYAKEKGYNLKVYKADWKAEPKKAGYLRNIEMHKYAAQNDNRGVVAFWDGQSLGTKQSFQLANQYNNDIKLIDVSNVDNALLEQRKLFNELEEKEMYGELSEEEQEKYNKLQYSLLKRTQKQSKLIKEQTQNVEKTEKGLPEAKAIEELNKTLNEAVNNQQVQEEQREVVKEPKDLNTRKNEIYEALNNPDEYTPEELNAFERELADIIIEQNKQQNQETQNAQAEETEQQSQGTPVMQEDSEMFSDADYVSDTEYNRESPTEEELNQAMQEADEETKREAEKIGVNADVYEHANKYHGYNRETSNHNSRVRRKYEKGLSKIQNKIDVLMEQQKDLRSSLKVDDNNYSDAKIKEIQDKISDIGIKLNALYKQKGEYQKEHKYGKKGMWHLDDAQIQDEGLDYGRQIVDTLQNENATAKDKLKVLDNIKNFAVVSFDTFKDIYDTIRFPEEQAEHLEKNKVDMKNEYNKYLDEKLRKSLYNGLKRHYDKVTMYDSDKLRQKESEAIVSRAWQNKRGKLVNEMGDALKILNFEGKKTNKLTSPLKTLSLWRSNMIRANEKAFGFEQGTAINNTIFRPLEHHLAEMQKFINDTHKKILDLGIKQNSSESTDLFDYMEQTITEEGIREKYKNNPEMGEKIIQAGETLQQMYDDLFYDVNDILSEYGFSTIKYRKNYVTHFQNAEDALSTLMKSITGEQSIEATENQIRNIANQELSQDKQRATSGYEKQRHTEEAQQKDAIMAAMKYVQNISSVKYLTEDIQKLRAFEQLMRQYNGMEDITDSTDLTGLTQNKLNQVEKNQLEKFRTDKQFHEYVNWLNQYTNVLAGGQLKFEEAFPPKVVKALNAFKSRTGSNMVGLNMKTPATNFISGILGISKTNKIAALRAIGQMMNNSITKTDDGVMKNSDLYTRRQGNKYTIEKTSKLGRFDQKAQEFGMKPMGFTDDIMTEFIIRSKYNEGLKRFQSKYTDSNGNINYEGLKEEAMKYADDHASRILGERSRGTMPLLFESKALGALTQFQLEVNNQLDVFTHDFFRQKYQDVKEYGENELNADVKAVSQATQLIVFQHLFNEAYDAVLGGKPAFDIIDVLQTAFGKGDDDDENDGLSVENLGKAGKQLVEMLPFINIISPNARVPIVGVLEDMLSDTKGLVEGTLEGDKKKRNKNAYALAQDLGSNIVLPTGGMQAKRSLQTAATYARNGNYNASGQLRYPLQEEDKTPARFAQALLWGRGNLPTAKRYEERGYKPLNDKQTEEFNSLNDVSYEDYLTIIDANKKEEGAYYKENTVDRINQAVKNEDDRWTLYQNYVMSDSQKAKFDEFLSSGFGTKEDILNNYDYMRENEINLPNYDKVEEMIDNGVNLDSYVKYQKDLDNMKNDQEQKELLYKLLKGKEIDLKSPDADAKATILMDDKYSDEERESLYKTFAGSDKDVSTYENFRDMGTGDSDEISTWLNFVIADTAATKKTGAYDNKTKTENDKQDKIEAFFNQHPEINETQRAYIKVNNGFKKITSRERDLINEYVKRLEPEDYNKFFDNINQGFVGINYSEDGGRNYVEWLNKKIK